MSHLYRLSVRSGVIVLLLFAGTLLFAQKGAKTQHADMEKLAPLVGDWKGDGWRMIRNGEKSTFSQSESVKWKLDQTILVIEGQGQSQNGQNVHQAFGVISGSKAPGKYTMHSYLANGRSTTASATMGENGQFVWWFDDGRSGTIRYTTSVSNDIWMETGEYSRDGENWRQFLEMELHRVGK